MSTYRLDKLFAPRSIAVVGGSPRDTSPGRAVLKNLRSGGFAGEIHLVNPHYDSLEGIAAVKSCDALPGSPDIVVIGVPPAAVPSVVRDAAANRPPMLRMLSSPRPSGIASKSSRRNRFWRFGWAAAQRLPKFLMARALPIMPPNFGSFERAFQLPIQNSFGSYVSAWTPILQRKTKNHLRCCAEYIVSLMTKTGAPIWCYCPPIRLSAISNR